MEPSIVKIPTFSFDHLVADLIIDLEKLREANIQHGKIKNTFMILKEIFHVLESVGQVILTSGRTLV